MKITYMKILKRSIYSNRAVKFANHENIKTSLCEFLSEDKATYDI